MKRFVNGKDALPDSLSVALADIDVGLVLQCVEPHWTTKTQTMSRVRGRIESIRDRVQHDSLTRGQQAAALTQSRWSGFLFVRSGANEE